MFSLCGVDVVLGLEWSATLGEVRADFGNLKLSIGKGPVERVLQGDPTLGSSFHNRRSCPFIHHR